MPGFWPIFVQAQGAIQKIMGEKIVFEKSVTWLGHIGRLCKKHQNFEIYFCHVRRRLAAKRLTIQPPAVHLLNQLELSNKLPEIPTWPPTFRGWAIRKTTHKKWPLLYQCVFYITAVTLILNTGNLFPFC